MNKAMQLMREGRTAEALSRLKRYTLQNPGNVDAAVLLAQWLMTAGETGRAGTVLLEQVARHPRDGRVRLLLAELHRRRGDVENAEKHYREALALLPKEAAVAHNYAMLLQLNGRVDDAVAIYEEALRRKPDFTASLHNLASIRLAQGELDAAEASFRRVLELEAGHLNAIYNLGVIAERRGELDLAESHYVEVLRRDAGAGQALFALASLLFRRNRNLDWAEKCYKAFIRQQPESARAYNELGMLLAAQGRADEAIPCFEAAVDFSRDADSSLAPRENLINLLISAGRMKEALRHLEKLASLRPNDASVLLETARLKLACCDWDGLDTLVARFEALEPNTLPDRMSPLHALTVPGLSAETRLAISRRQIEQVSARMRTAGTDARRPRRRPARSLERQPTRVGYLFTDLDGFTPSRLVEQLVASHDDGCVELSVYTFNDKGTNPGARRVADAAKRFCELGAMSRLEAVERIRADKLDLLVDFNGWTTMLHPQLLAARPAGVTASIAAAAGLGDSGLADFLLADEVLVPDDARDAYAGRLVRLPVSPRLVRFADGAGEPAGREAAGLPHDAIVFCSFAPVGLINAEVLDAWAGVLDAAPGSVLWLADPGESARGGLIAAAQSRGIDAARIVLADAEFVRQRPDAPALADLALDTWPFSAEAFVLDAAAAGLPVLTRLGEPMFGRAGASVMAAAGSPELIADSQERYVATALALAADAEHLRAQREVFRDRLRSSSLADPARVVQALEAAYRDLAVAQLP